METLLGVVSPLDKRTKAASIELRRREEASRLDHTSTSGELEEEAQYDDDRVDNLKFTGAFAKAKNNISAGVERTVWDFRTDAEVTADRKAAVAEAEDRAVRKAELEKNPKAKRPEPPSTTASIGKTVYRFVDTSAKSSK
ncbi:uncharacterized protein LOC62_02G003289 [Vanrija pseudolonga]|uniref:Uncharacterized protein n=1 Tax=Vanrija pseudolonga TaxID=143232 RepID=A0AAF0Y3T3_9TREE|nr:hypothetical protein LOC62_02G003289 [Vanrija pseudolonga]